MQISMSSDKKYLKRIACILWEICFGLYACTQDLDQLHSVAPHKTDPWMAQGCVTIKKNEWIYFTRCHTRNTYAPVSPQ